MEIENTTLTFDPSQMRAFLLGRLSESETAAIEERLIVDHEFYLEVKSAEDELIDDYALDNLAKDERDSVLQRASRQPEWADQLKMRQAFFTTLRRTSASNEVPATQPTMDSRNPVRLFGWFPKLVSVGLVAAVVVLVAACVFLLDENRGLQHNLAQTQRAAAGAVPPPSVVEQRSAAANLTTIFFPDYIMRGAAPQTSFRLHSQPSRTVEMQLEVPPSTSAGQRWDVSIARGSQTEFLQRGLAVRQIGSISFVQLYFDPSSLSPGTDSVSLSVAGSTAVPPTREWTLVVSQ